LSIKPSNLTEVLKGKRHVSALLALKIEPAGELKLPFDACSEIMTYKRPVKNKQSHERAAKEK